jgi:hypothetical protein
MARDGKWGRYAAMSIGNSPVQPDRNLALELVRVTEAAALAAALWVGRGDKNEADQAAVTAMRHVLGGVAMDGTVVIGEGEKDEAPMLYTRPRCSTSARRSATASRRRWISRLIRSMAPA